LTSGCSKSNPPRFKFSGAEKTTHRAADVIRATIVRALRIWENVRFAGVRYYRVGVFSKPRVFFYKALNKPQTISEKEYEQANSELTGFHKKTEKIITSDGISLIEKKTMQHWHNASERLNKQLDVLSRNQKNYPKN
jgi:hypothetical protein